MVLSAGDPFVGISEHSFSNSPWNFWDICWIRRVSSGLFSHAAREASRREEGKFVVR